MQIPKKAHDVASTGTFPHTSNDISKQQEPSSRLAPALLVVYKTYSAPALPSLTQCPAHSTRRIQLEHPCTHTRRSLDSVMELFRFSSVILLVILSPLSFFASAFSGEFEISGLEIEAPFQADPISISNTTVSCE